jgi:hypothetical protein
MTSHQDGFSAAIGTIEILGLPETLKMCERALSRDSTAYFIATPHTTVYAYFYSKLGILMDTEGMESVGPNIKHRATPDSFSGICVSRYLVAQDELTLKQNFILC